MNVVEPRTFRSLTVVAPCPFRAFNLVVHISQGVALGYLATARSGRNTRIEYSALPNYQITGVTLRAILRLSTSSQYSCWTVIDRTVLTYFFFQLFEQIYGTPDFRFLAVGLLRNFAFNGEGTGVANFL